MPQRLSCRAARLGQTASLPGAARHTLPAFGTSCRLRLVDQSIPWCRLRADFRNFRPDRIDAVADTGEHFTERSATNLDAYLAAMRSYYAGMD